MMEVKRSRIGWSREWEVGIWLGLDHGVVKTKVDWQRKAVAESDSAFCSQVPVAMVAFVELGRCCVKEVAKDVGGW